MKPDYIIVEYRSALNVSARSAYVGYTLYNTGVNEAALVII